MYAYLDVAGHGHGADELPVLIRRARRCVFFCDGAMWSVVRREEGSVVGWDGVGCVPLCRRVVSI